MAFLNCRSHAEPASADSPLHPGLKHDSDLAASPPIALCINGNCPASETAAASDDFHPEGFSLVFADEFDGDQLDRDAWCTRYIYGGGARPQIRDEECQRKGEGTRDVLNDEQQRYVDFNKLDQPMHVVKSGVLSLRATKTGNAKAAYEAAMLRSKQLFLPTPEVSYYITARVMLPNVRGTWPSFWLNSDRKPDGTTNWPPEIDIFEGALNEKEDKANMIRVGAQIRSNQQTSSGKREITFSASDFDRKWNNYRAPRSLRDVWIEVAVKWTVDDVCYYVDGYRVMCENYRWTYNHGAPAAPAHLLLNLAIGGSWAGRHGIADAKFPAEFRVDHVRVYKAPA
jgi:beta-glucanase (GH16 family)